ncbi:MAG: hypothetical protein Unbinned5855contig1001_29 [Prokaryotic dsDNA virus sp.]|nr:MAG: hypothetical protein Unbinned5855contig1001_29 [Prokaryotic dsDNA virus sp.]|tara:strand:- start:11832 stop:13703 length:1872 start_codon:yes stop_codon:yes gene_type:complete
MATLTNTKIKDTYPGLLKTTDNAALGGTYKLITDGLGNSSGVYLGTGGNVGIGQSSPTTYKLDVNGTFRAVSTAYFESGINAASYIFHQGDTNTFFGFPANDTFTITTNNVERMRIDSSGRMGIGRIATSHILEINGEMKIVGLGANEGIDAYNNSSNQWGIKSTSATGEGIKFEVANSERMRIDSSGNVGINCTPNKLLEISDTLATTLRITSTKNGTWTTSQELGRLEWFGNDTSGEGAAVKGFIALKSSDTFGAGFHMTFGTTDGTNGIQERMQIRRDGNVGIGTEDPAELLTVSASDDVSIRINSTKNGTWTTDQKLGALEFFGNDTSSGGAGLKGYINLTSENTFGAAFNMNFGVGANATDRMVITYDGNVGIGYTNPQQKLEVSGTSRFSRNGAESAQYMELIPTSTGNTLKAVGSSKSLIFDNTSSTTNEIHFRQGGSNKMIIKSGVVLVGKTSSSSFNTEGIELSPTGLGVFTRAENSSLLVNRTGSDGSVISIRNDNVVVGTISVSGSTTSYNTSSDYRLKENVVDMTGALDRIEQLQPKRFNFISEETTVDGFIAHEVQSVIPEAVFGEKDAVDEEGNPEYQGIDQAKIVPLLVGAIKELKAEIETLKSQINS